MTNEDKYSELLNKLFEKEECRNQLKQQLLNLDKDINELKKEIDKMISTELPQVRIVII
ncbi:MAG: hypothetical protein MST05_04660 [Treponema sp.]|nr:hypothetical protein [Treponema sp.]